MHETGGERLRGPAESPRGGGGVPKPSAPPFRPQKFTFTAKNELQHGFLKKPHKPVQNTGKRRLQKISWCRQGT